jgi:phenylalanyl-tRNA synthetase alpha chain
MPSPTTTLSPSQLAQDLGDRVREALGHDADAVEEVTVLAETPPGSP